MTPESGFVQCSSVTPSRVVATTLIIRLTSCVLFLYCQQKCNRSAKPRASRSAFRVIKIKVSYQIEMALRWLRRARGMSALFPIYPSLTALPSAARSAIAMLPMDFPLAMFPARPLFFASCCRNACYERVLESRSALRCPGGSCTIS